MNEKKNELYTRILNQIGNDELTETSRAIEVMKTLMDQSDDPRLQKNNEETWEHILEVCEILIDLALDISVYEKDTLLAAVILHPYPEYFPYLNLSDEIIGKHHFSKDILEVINCVTLIQGMTGEDLRAFYQRLQQNKLALLLALADRGNVVQKLYQYSTWDAHRYINETRICYYPMCIYGKEHYHELLGPITILMEKIKCLLEVAEVLIHKYEMRESELVQDILNLQEENATIRGIIRNFQAGSLQEN